MKNNRILRLLTTLLLVPALTGCSGGTAEQASSLPSSTGRASAAESSATTEGSQDESSMAAEGSQDESSTVEERSQDESSIVAEGSQDESSADGLTDEEIKQMHEAGERISVICKSSDYLNSDMEKRAEMVLELLNELADEGLVIKASISRYDDSISFRYSCGVLGGVMLREWDPNMN